MAAGQSTRYKKSKQLEKLFNGFNLMDYSIYDALKVGFKKIILIINKKQEIEFREKYQKLITKNILKLVIQRIDDLPENLTNKTERTKPWGTAHCVFCLRNYLQTPFLIINCDDFYGRNSFQKMFTALKTSQLENHFFMVGYQLINTLSKQGAVSRGICYSKQEKLIQIQEEHNLKLNEVTKQIKNKNKFFLLDTLVSMNFWGFTPSFFTLLLPALQQFFAKKNLNETEEFYLPNVINQLIKDAKIEVTILKTNDEWFGLTFLEDRQKTIDKIKNLVDNQSYPRQLF